MNAQEKKIKKDEGNGALEAQKNHEPEHSTVHGPEPSAEGGLVQGIEELKKSLEDCEKTKLEYLEGWQRAKADFLNYKKEEAERVGEFLKFALEEFILKILPILDNFDLAEKKLPEDLKNDENTKGLLQIKTQILDFLKNQGVEEIKTIGDPPCATAEAMGDTRSHKASEGQRKFDPNLMEAVEEVEVEGVELGVVVEEVQKGYKINGRLLRPAKVRVTK